MGMTQLELLAYLHKLKLAQCHLADYAAAVLDVVPALHHRLICSAIDDMLEGDVDELIINTPPGAAKSTYTSHALAAYFLGRWPNKNVILSTHTAELSERWSRKVRSSVSSPMHVKLFPGSELSKDSTAVARWATSVGGELLAAGVGGSILGFRADLGIIDDPISGFEQAQSITQLEKVHSWYETDFVTRLKPGAKVVLICQRLSPNDLAGYMIQRNMLQPTRKQKVLILTMECEDSANDPLGREVGERLWPEWFTPEMVADAKRDEFKWKTLYQQKPPSEDGSWVSTDDIQFAPPPELDKLRLYGMTDLALSVNSGDYTVHMVVGVDKDDNWYVVDALRARVSPDVSAQNVVNLSSTYKPCEWLIDDDNASKVFMGLVATEARQQSVSVQWKPLPMRGQNKETRAAPLRGQFKRRKVFLPSTAEFTSWLVTELLSFPNALGEGVDDGVDALGLMGRRMVALSRPQLKVVQTLPKIETPKYTLDELWPTAKRRYEARI